MNLTKYKSVQAFSAKASIVALSLFLLILLPVWSVEAQVFSTRAKQAIAIDVGSGSVLLTKDADQRIGPASMAKVLTLAVVFDALSKGQVALHDTVTISENAWRTGGANSGGSTMFAELGSDVAVEDLLRGIAIQSGNDACIAIAEGLSGTEEAFAVRMNEFARKIGMTDSNFTNSTGLPDENQYTTARDLATLAVHVIETYPDLYGLFSEQEFTWNKIRQFNRNPLLKQNIGADGLKTGFTKESGYGLMASALQDNRRVVLVMSGMETKKERAEEAKRMMDWAFRSFHSVEIFQKGEVLGGAKVFGGEKSRVDVVARKSISVLRLKGDESKARGRVFYRGPLKAPVEAGVEIGEIVITLEGKEVQRHKVYTDEDIAVGTLQQRALDSILELTLGWF